MLNSSILLPFAHWEIFDMESSRILLAEPYEDLASSISFDLTTLGYCLCAIVKTAEQALENCRNDKPDLVIMDIQMEGDYRGIEVAGIIQKELFIPVIFTTAFLDQDLLKRAKIVAPFGYLFKPPKQRDLLATIEMALHAAHTDKERRIAEEALKKSEERYRLVFETAPYGIQLTDLEGKIIFSNPAHHRIQGCAPGELQGRYIWDLIATEEGRKKAREFYRQVAEETLEPSFFYNQDLTLDGRLIDVQIFWDYVYDEKGKLEGLISIINDITEQKRLEWAKQQQAQIVAQIRESVITTDLEGFITGVNKGTEKLHGFTESELLGKPVNILFPEEHAQIFTTVVKKNLEKKDEYSLEIPMLRKSGDPFFAHLSLTLLKDADDNPMGTVGFAIDMTDRRKNEERIRNNLKEKETLLQEIHHRVKNNMQVVASLLQLQASRSGDETVKRALDESRNRIFAMSTMHEILYRSDNLSEIELKPYISKLLNTLVTTYPVSNVKIDMKIDEDDASISIEKASALGLIINELVSNALKYAFPDERNGQITIELKRLAEKKMKLRVKDDGIGLPKGFDWKHPKTLGLQLVQILSEDQLDGALHCHSGQGSLFEVQFEID